MQLAQCCVVRSQEPLIVGKARRSLGPSPGEPRTARDLLKAALLRLTWIGLDSFQ